MKDEFLARNGNFIHTFRPFCLITFRHLSRNFATSRSKKFLSFSTEWNLANQFWHCRSFLTDNFLWICTAFFFFLFENGAAKCFFLIFHFSFSKTSLNNQVSDYKTNLRLKSKFDMYLLKKKTNLIFGHSNYYEICYNSLKNQLISKFEASTFIKVESKNSSLTMTL